MNLSPHFTLEELTHSDTARAEGIPNQPTAAEVAALRALCEQVLEPLRAALGRSVKVNSGYRGPALNRRIGGATSSQHLSGQAADIQCPGVPVVEVFQLAIRLGLPFDQIIYEANRSARWVHVSHRAGANRGDIRTATFGPDGRPVAYPSVTVEQAMALREPVTRSSRAAVPGYVERADEPLHEEVVSPQRPPPPATRSRAQSTPALPGATAKASLETPVKTARRNAAVPSAKPAVKSTVGRVRQPTAAVASTAAPKQAPKSVAKKTVAKKTVAKTAATKQAAPVTKKPAGKTPVKTGTRARKPAKAG